MRAHTARDRPHADAPLVIIADDLTGALDAAAPFAPLGVAVATDVAALPAALATRAAVVAVSTRTREADDATAARRISAARSVLPASARLFKKVDSRLKGPIAAELAALGAVDVLVVPAVPEFGRVVQGGAVAGFGVATPIPVRDCLGTAPAAIPDTLTDADLDAALAAAPGSLVVGARGATCALARSFGIVPRTPPPLAPPLAVVVGSRDPITLAQLDRLRAAPDLAGITVLTAPAEERSADAIGASLGAAVRAIADDLAGLVLTGGATAEAVLDALAITVLAVEGELLPGVPVSRANGLRIVTKSGGFGTPQTLALLAGVA